MSRRTVLPAPGLVLVLTCAGCATAPLQPAGILSSYTGLKPDDGLVHKSLARIDMDALKRVKTVRIASMAVVPNSGKADLSREQRQMLANAVSRAVCNAISTQFTVALPDQPADLTVTGSITYIGPTNLGVSAASQAASIAGSVLIPVPGVPVPRIPIGMGALAVEAEARDARGEQVAAYVWARGADMITSKARLSPFGDAYDLADNFGRDLSAMLKYGPDRTLGQKVAGIVPSVQEVRFAVNGRPDAPACAAFGEGPGLPGMISAGMGAPPEWADRGVEPASLAATLGRADRGAKLFRAPDAPDSAPDSKAVSANR